MFLAVFAPIGWLLPIVPGNLFFLTGLILLSTEYAWARKTVRWLRHRFSKATWLLEETAMKAARIRNHGLSSTRIENCSKICCAADHQWAD